MSTLYLNLKGEFFDTIKSGTKAFEYRLYNDYWKKRLLNADGSLKSWDGIVVRRGYPTAGDPDREIARDWRCAVVETITHEHFGQKPVAVFAICKLTNAPT
jgi:hypothetical protein